MDEYEAVAESETGFVELTNPINIEQIVNGQIFEINQSKIRQEEEFEYNPEDYSSGGFCNDDIFDPEDEDCFEKLSKKMTPLPGHENKIKKLITKEGAGEYPPENAHVMIYYRIFSDIDSEPIDIVFAKKIFSFHLGSNSIYGMNFAVQSMKPTEKALFLIHPDYTFGKLGHPPRIPGNVDLLFDIELVRYVDSGPAFEYHQLSEEEKRSFPVANKTARGLMEHAKELFKRDVRRSIKEYNKALGLLEYCSLKDMEQQETQQRLILDLLKNLAVCYTADKNYKKACAVCHRAIIMVKGTCLKVPSKIHFHHGRALYNIGEYERARTELQKAKEMEPHNKEIAMEIAKINQKIIESKEQEKNLAKLCLQTNTNNKKNETQKNEIIEDPFQVEIARCCQDLKRQKDKTSIPLPSSLTDSEIKIVKTEVEKHGLYFKHVSMELGENKYIISKV